MVRSSWRRRVGWLVAGLVLVGVPAAAYEAGQRVRSPAQAAADAAPPIPSVITAPVERRVLTDAVVFRGDVIAAGAVEVGAPSLSAETVPVVTDVRVGVGDPVVEGAVLVVVSDRPVLVLEGLVPAYRSLGPASRGLDVAQLQDGLARLGFDVGDDEDGVFGAGTQAAVAAWYREAGFEPVPSSPDDTVKLAEALAGVDAAERALAGAQEALADGRQVDPGAVAQSEVALGQSQRALNSARDTSTRAIQAADGAVSAARREVDRLVADPLATAEQISAARQVLAVAEADRARIGGEQAGLVADAEDGLRLAELAYETALEPPDVDALRRGVVDAEAALTAAQRSYFLVSVSAGVTVPRGEVVFVPELPARVSSSNAVIGASVGGGAGAGPTGSEAGALGAGGGGASSPGSALLGLSIGSLEVRGGISAGDRPLVQEGAVAVLDVEVTGDRFDAVVAEIAEEPVAGPAGGLEHEVVLDPATEIPDGLLGANLRVTIAAASTDGPVLVVPLAAVSAKADGTLRVTVLRADGVQVEVPVEAGLSAVGYVEITPIGPGGLAEGDRVVIGVAGLEPAGAAS